MYKPSLKVRPSSGPLGDLQRDPHPPQPPNFSDGDSGYEILYRKKTTKKHKTWEGDAVAVPRNDVFIIKADSKAIATIPADKISPGAFFSHGQYEFEVGTKTAIRPATPEISKNWGAAKPSSTAIPVRDKSLTTLLSSAGHVSRPHSRPASDTLRPTFTPAEVLKNAVNTRASSPSPPAPSTTKAPVKSNTKPAAPIRVSKPTVYSASSLFPPEPKKACLEREENKQWAIPPLIATKLRPHQTEAVNFLYECISGSKHCYGNGAMLADDMGLGKTLTSIALIYSMLEAGLVSTVLVACPATLVKNWRNEFRKWLPANLINVFCLIPGEDPKIFSKPGLRRTYPVMIAGYERIRTIAPQISDDMGEFDLVICDEGHRLKGTDSKTLSSLVEISGPKRIILSGTPIQNNLQEFWTMAEFLNAGVFGSKKSRFVQKFSDPIQASRDMNASPEAKVLGQEKMRELIETTNEFVLRREQSVLAGHLTVPKTELVVFCKPLDTQVVGYTTELADTHFWDSDGASGGQALQLITRLRKAATSTQLLKPKPSTSGSFAQQLNIMDPLAGSNKMVVLKEMLEKLYRDTDEKVVIVSGYTETLDLVQQVCGKYNMSWVRLDGSTPQNKRQGMVNIFNNSPKERVFAFILSAKSGGVGLNLIGASRLIMIDCDWNPSVDMQAMARIHRDGQKRPTFIYRLLSAGTIDEKIFQRQLTKQGVSDSLFELENPQEAGNKFTQEQLREIFAYKDCKCDTLEQGITLEYEELLEGYEPALEAASDNSGLINCVLKKIRQDQDMLEPPKPAD